MAPAYRLLLLVLVATFALPAQKTDSQIRGSISTTSSGAKIRRDIDYKGGPEAPLNKPESVLQVLKVKGTVQGIDLKKRTVTVLPRKSKAGLELGFPQPAGREQIKVSKKAAKILGTKKLKLEELKVGSKVRLRYYPALGQLMELIIEQPKS